MIVLYVYTPVQQNNNIFLLISLNPTLVVCRKKSVLSVSLSLSLSLALLFLFTRHEVRLLVVILAARAERKVEKKVERYARPENCDVLTCVRPFPSFETNNGGRGHLFSLLAY